MSTEAELFALLKERYPTASHVLLRIGAGKAVQQVMRHGVRRVVRELRSLRSSLENTLKHVKNDLKEVELEFPEESVADGTN